MTEYRLDKASNSLCGIEIDKQVIPKMNIYDKAASVKSFSNASSPRADSEILKFASKSDAIISESSISFVNQNQAYISQLFREESKEESSRVVTDKKFKKL